MFKLILRIIFSALGLFLAYRLIDVEKVVSVFNNLRPFPFVKACLLYIISDYIGAVAWYYVIKSTGKQISLSSVVSAYWTGLFFNNFLPSSAGGDAVKGFHIIRQYQDPGLFTATIVIDRIINLFFLLLIGMSASYFIFRNRIIFIILIGSVSGFIFCIAVFNIIKVRRIGILTGSSPVRQFLYNFTSAFSSFAAFRSRILYITLLLSFCSQFIKIYLYKYLIAAAGSKLALIIMFIFVPVFGLSAMLPVSIGGLGIREIAGLKAAALLSVNQNEIIVLSLTGYLAFLLSNSLGIFYYILSPGKNQRKT